MAGFASPALDGEEAGKLDVLRETLYHEMQQHGSAERLYNQKDLIDLGIIPNDDILLLLRVVQGLCDDYRLVSTNDGRSGLAWRWRSREDCRKYVNTTPVAHCRPALLLSSLFSHGDKQVADLTCLAPDTNPFRITKPSWSTP